MTVKDREDVDVDVAGSGFVARRLISTPMNANGAQDDTAQGIPQIATRNVAKRTDRANGAKNMVPANSMCEIIHAVCRSGRT